MYVDDGATVLSVFVAALLCHRAARHNRGRLRLFWQLLAAAAWAWTAAEAIWDFYDLVLKRAVPVPSWADVGYLGAIPLTVAALLVHPAMRDGAVRRARAAIDGIVVATAVAFVGWSLVLGPLWRLTDLSTAGGVVAVAYPFGDIVMVALIVLIVRAMEPHRRTALWFVLAGLVAMAVTDSTYTYLTEVKNYSSGNILDVGWIVAYLLLAVGAYCGGAGEAVEVSPDLAAPPSLVSVVVPYLVVLVALGTTAVQIRLGHRLDRAAWYMALGLVLLVLARQGLLVADTVRLRKEGLASGHALAVTRPSPVLSSRTAGCRSGAHRHGGRRASGTHTHCGPAAPRHLAGDRLRPRLGHHHLLFPRPLPPRNPRARIVPPRRACLSGRWSTCDNLLPPRRR